jgi:transcriptional regulator with XRE-family HTH domain
VGEAVTTLRDVLVVKLRRAADAKGLDDRALAIRSGVQQRRIARLWKGERFSLETVEKLARALRLRWSDLALVESEDTERSHG